MSSIVLFFWMLSAFVCVGRGAPPITCGETVIEDLDPGEHGGRVLGGALDDSGLGVCGTAGGGGLDVCGALGGGRLGTGMFLCVDPDPGNDGGGRDGGAPAGNWRFTLLIFTLFDLPFPFFLLSSSIYF